MTERVKCWISAYRKECSKHSQKKMSDDIDKLLQPEQIETFRNSPCSLSAVKIIGSAVDSSKLILTQTEYVTVRDFC